MIKKLLYCFVAALIVFSSTNSIAQTVSITANPGTSGNIVIGQAAFHASESIYLNSEIGASNYTTTATAINHIDFSINAAGDPTTIGTFKVYLKEVTTATFSAGAYSVSGYTLVFNGSYASATASASGWAGIDLTTPFKRTSGKNLQVLIVRSGTANSGYVFDAAVGNTLDATLNTSRRVNAAAATTSLAVTIYRPTIQFVHANATDASLTGLVLPAISCYTTPQTIGVTVKNSGLSTVIGAGQASVALSITGANPFNATIANTASIPVGGTETINFTGIDFSAPGANTIQAIVTFAGDTDAAKDTAKGSNSRSSIITLFPAVENVETSPLPVFGYVKPLVGGQQLWNLINGKYKNKDYSDSLAANTGSRYFLFDSYSGTAGNTGILYSKCMQLPVVGVGSIFNVNFYMSHDTSFSAYHDTLFVNVSNDRGATWTRLASFERYDGSFTTAGWSSNDVDISAYSGQNIQIAFEGKSDYGNIIGLDDITVTASTPLPVSLLDFNATRSNKVNKLNWTTSQEVNSSYFVIERSTDGQNYKPIGRVNAKGNSTIQQQYSFTDNTPTKGTNYYRLKAVDNNSFGRYSLVRSIRNEGTADVTVYPNPIQSTMQVQITADKADKAIVSVVEMSGKVIYSNAISLTEGLNNLKFNANELHLNSGTYYLKIQLSDDLIVKKIAKL